MFFLCSFSCKPRQNSHHRPIHVTSARTSLSMCSPSHIPFIIMRHGACVETHGIHNQPMKHFVDQPVPHPLQLQTGRANAITPPATFSFSAPHQQLLPPNDPKVKSIDSGTPLMSEQQDTTAKVLNTTSCSDADNCDDQELLILSDENNDI